MRRNFIYLFHFLKSSQFIFLMLPLLFHGYLTYFYTGENRLFVMFNQFTLFISIVPLCLVFFRSYIHSNLISVIAIILSTLFYGNIYFGFFDISKTTGMYLGLLLMATCFLSIKSLVTLQEIQQIDGFKNLPLYDCMEVALLSNFEETYAVLDPDQKEFTKFKFHFKNCYAAGGWIYHDNEKYAFSNVRDYLNEQKVDINHLSNDDFKLISMIFI